MLPVLPETFSSF